jgi:acetate kinase
MTEAILVLNAGSSSIKFCVFASAQNALQSVFKGQVESLYTSPHFTSENSAGEKTSEFLWSGGTRLGHEGGIAYIVDFLRTNRQNYRLAAVGHRVVHGGVQFSEPVLIGPGVVEQLDKLVPLAPLHQPHNLAPIRAIAKTLPNMPQVACFDTAFHRVQSELAQAYALPHGITERGVRRYGFHGLSYEYIAGALPALDTKAAAGRVVVAHLGNGASMCAMSGGRSVASTMGFTAVDGLPMGTRSGALDPGVVLYLIDELRMSTRTVEKLIYQESGLLGVSGISSDMRTLIASSEPRAKFAVELFVYRVRRELGSLVAALDGLDALVFTGGIGERAASIREKICLGAAWTGLVLDRAANEAGGPRISAPDSRISAWVVPTNEELMIARHTHELVHSAVAV